MLGKIMRPTKFHHSELFIELLPNPRQLAVVLACVSRE